MTGKLQLTVCKILHLLLQIQQLHAAAGVTSVWITSFCSTECFGCTEQTQVRIMVCLFSTVIKCYCMQN